MIDVVRRCFDEGRSLTALTPAKRQPAEPNAKRNRRRRLILEAAETCFAMKGFHQTSMQEIAQGAGLSVGNIYRYFTGKDEIILAFAEDDREELHGVVDRLNDDVATFSDVIDAVLEIAEKFFDPNYARLGLEIASEASRNAQVAAAFAENENRLRASFTRCLERLRSDGEIDPNLDVKAVVFLVFTVFDGLVGRSIFRDQISQRHLLDTLRQFLERALQSK